MNLKFIQLFQLSLSQLFIIDNKKKTTCSAKTIYKILLNDIPKCYANENVSEAKAKIHQVELVFSFKIYANCISFSPWDGKLKVFIYVHNTIFKQTTSFQIDTALCFIWKSQNLKANKYFVSHFLLKSLVFLMFFKKLLILIVYIMYFAIHILCSFHRLIRLKDYEILSNLST